MFMKYLSFLAVFLILFLVSGFRDSDKNKFFSDESIYEFSLAVNGSTLRVEVTADSVSGPAVLTVNFAASAGGGSGKYYYFWDFNDTDGFQIEAVGDSITRPFGFPGKYNVTVKAWDDNGNWGSNTITINVDSGSYTPSQKIHIYNEVYPANNPRIIEGLDFSDSSSTQILIEGTVENVIIRRNRFRNYKAEKGFTGGGAIQILGTVNSIKGIIIEENLFVDDFKAIDAGGVNDIQIRNNVFKRIGYESGVCGESVRILNSSDIVVEGNLVDTIGATYEANPPGIDLPLSSFAIVVGGWDVYNFVIKNNFMYNVLGVGIFLTNEMVDTTFSTPYATIEGNFIQNIVAREFAIGLMHYYNCDIIRNYIDYSNNFGISIFYCDSIKIGDNVIINPVNSGINMNYSHYLKVYHNTLIRGPELLGLPSNERGFGIWLAEECGEPYLWEGQPEISSNVIVMDNVIDGYYEGGIHISQGGNHIVDENVIGLVDTNVISLNDANRNTYLRIIDSTETSIAGSNNFIRKINYISKDENVYFLLSSDPSYSSVYDGYPAGAIWDKNYTFDVDTSDIKDSYHNENMLVNSGAEEGDKGIWNIIDSSNVSNTVFEVVSEAQIGDLTVKPHSGSNFFFSKASRPQNGESFLKISPLILDLSDISEQIDKGNTFFKLSLYAITSDIENDFKFEARALFWGDEESFSYSVTPSIYLNWVSPGYYRRFTIYGLIPPEMRNLELDLYSIASGSVSEFAFAFDDVSFNILTEYPLGINYRTGHKIVKLFKLYQNYPNPFNPETKINYVINCPGNVKLIIYNLLGQEVARLVDEYQRPGEYNVMWNASNLPSGVYIYRLKVNDYSEVRKCVLLK